MFAALPLSCKLTCINDGFQTVLDGRELDSYHLSIPLNVYQLKERSISEGKVLGMRFNGSVNIA